MRNNKNGNYSELNGEQLKAVESYKGALYVMAPIGTGKTKVMALRAAYAFENGINPQNMLCLTFTNKAAKEIKDRLMLQIGRDSQKIYTGTFHSFCASIIRFYSDKLGISSDFTIYDEEDTYSDNLLVVLCVCGKCPVRRHLCRSARGYIAEHRRRLHHGGRAMRRGGSGGSRG